MDADIALNEVETRVADKALNGIRADIQTVDIKIIILQQTFCQMVTDKTVYAQNQYTRAAFDQAVRLIPQANFRHNAHLVSQLRALRI